MQMCFRSVERLFDHDLLAVDDIQPSRKFGYIVRRGCSISISGDLTVIVAGNCFGSGDLSIFLLYETERILWPDKWIRMNKFDEINRVFESLRNPEKAKEMSRYMRDQFKYFGIPTPERRAAYKNILREVKKTKSIDWEFLETCWQAEEREFQYFVLDYLETLQKFLSFDNIPRIERFVRSRQWWDTIDSLDMIIGKIGLTDSRVNDLMLKWSLDDDFWVRRVAIDHQLCRRENTDTELLEMILVNNFGSTEFFINKAIGWSLRDYSKTNPEWVKEFIERHGDKMSPLSIREASKYI